MQKYHANRHLCLQTTPKTLNCQQNCQQTFARSPKLTWRGLIPPVDLSGLTVEPLDTAVFLKKVGEYDSQIAGKRRAQLNASQKQQLESFEKQIVSLTGWLVSAYSGPPETTNCGSATFHDWHLEIFENASDHAPRISDPTPIICEITPRIERAIYRENVRIQALTEFFRRRDNSFQPTGHSAQEIRVTGFLLWDDEHNGTADVGTTIQWFSTNGLHHPWRASAIGFEINIGDRPYYEGPYYWEDGFQWVWVPGHWYRDRWIHGHYERRGVWHREYEHEHHDHDHH